MAGTTPQRLIAIALLGCAVGAVFGAAPLAAWVDASPAGGTRMQQAADDWSDLMQRLGLDRPYVMLRAAVRAAEATR